MNFQYKVHLDRRNFGYLAGKFASNGFLITALLAISEEFNPAPKPRMMSLF
jgi:hypothetical protein